MSGQVSRAEERAKRSEGPSASPGRRRRLLQTWAPYLFLLPFMVVFLVFLVLPLAYALGISVFETRLVGGNVFVGLGYYVHDFGDWCIMVVVQLMILFGTVL